MRHDSSKEFRKVSDGDPFVHYKEVEIQPEHEGKINAAFDLLFEAVMEAGFSYPQSARIPQLTTMSN